MDANLAPGFQKELPGVLDKVVEDLAQMLDVEIKIDTSAIELQALADLYDTAGPGVVCCRSIFVRKVNGIGGMFIGQEIADGLSRAAMMMDPAEEGEEFDWAGLVREAMEEIFNIFVGSWNTTASPDYRLGSKTDERAVEYYPTNVPFPEAAGVFPSVIRLPLTFGDRDGFLAVFVPLKAIHGRDVANFNPPTQFVSSTAPANTGATEAATPAAAAPPRYDGPAKPVVFLDYTGLVIPWIKRFASSQGAQCLLASSLDPALLADDADTPAATIVMGLKPGFLENLGADEVSFVEIRPEKA